MQEKGYQEIFRRVEKKYLLDAAQLDALLKQAGRHMEPDRYGHYTICSLYMDTDDYHLIRTSLEKPLYKEKLRLRSYGVPDEDGTVFLELKKKYKGVTYKRRVSLPLRQAEEVVDKGTAAAAGLTGSSEQILREIGWFIDRYRPSPKALIAYDRTAFSGKEDESGLRLTLDSAVRWRETGLDLTAGDHGQPLLPDGTTLMEIKTPGAIPLWLCRVLSQWEIYPASFSKYGACYRQHLLREGQRRPEKQHIIRMGGIVCA